MSTLTPPISSTDGWVNIMLTIVLIIVVVVAVSAYPFTKWYAKRQKDNKRLRNKEDK